MDIREADLPTASGEVSKHSNRSLTLTHLMPWLLRYRNQYRETRIGAEQPQINLTLITKLGPCMWDSIESEPGNEVRSKAYYDRMLNLIMTKRSAN